MAEGIEAILERASLARREHRLEDAKRDLVEAVRISRAAGVKSDLARTLKALGQIERDTKHPELALPVYEEAVAIYRNEDDPLALAHTIRHVADIQRELGLLDLAEPGYGEALAIYRAHGETSRLDLANAIRGLAILTFDSGRAEEARALWREARDLYAAANVEAGVRESTRRLAELVSIHHQP